MAQKPLLPGSHGRAPALGIRVPPPVVERIDAAAKRHGLTRSAWLREIVDEALAQERQERPA